MRVSPEDLAAAAALHPACPGLLHLDDDGTVGARTQLQLEVALQREEGRDRDMTTQAPIRPRTQTPPNRIETFPGI